MPVSPRIAPQCCSSKSKGSRKPSKRRPPRSRKCACQHRAREVRVARDDRERDLLWKGRKNAFGALGRLSPMYYVQDGVIPRTRLPETLRCIEEVGRHYELHIGNIFHAGRRQSCIH